MVTRVIITLPRMQPNCKKMGNPAIVQMSEKPVPKDCNRGMRDVRKIKKASGKYIPNASVEMELVSYPALKERVPVSLRCSNTYQTVNPRFCRHQNDATEPEPVYFYSMLFVCITSKKKRSGNSALKNGVSTAKI